MPTSYGELVNKSGTIYNVGTGQGYSNANELAKALGTTTSGIQWGNITSNPNWSFNQVFSGAGTAAQSSPSPTSNTPIPSTVPVVPSQTTNTQNTSVPTVNTTQNTTNTTQNTNTGTNTGTQTTPQTVNSTDLIGQRPSPSNPKVMEFYNKQTGQGFATPQELSTFVNQQGQSTTPTTVFEALKKGFDQVKDTTAPQDQGAAGKTIDQFTSSGIVNVGNIEQALAADPGYQQLLKDYQAYTNTATQSSSLLDTYKQLMESTGLTAVNTELLNTKKIIEGTEDDIRNEVTAANGFATESQVLALSNARNKSLIKNYNALVDQANSIQSQINTMVGLSAQDRENALNMARTKLDIDQQINSYRDKFISNAREGYTNYINAVGYDGLYKALQNDPTRLSLVERTLGLPSGTIASAAFKEQQQQGMENALKQAQLDAAQFELANAQEMAPLEKKLKQAQIADIYSGINNRGAGNVTETIEKIGDKNYIVTKQNGVITGMTEFTGQQMSTADQAVKNIMASSSSWGEAADKINKLAGNDQAATAYDAQLRAYFGQGKDLDKVFSSYSAQDEVSRGKLEERISVIDSLTKDRYLNASVGTNALGRHSFLDYFTGGKANFIGEVEKIKSELNLDALIGAKNRGATFGALSDQELRLLGASATKIKQWEILDDKGKVTGYSASEKDFRHELERIKKWAIVDYVKKGGSPDEAGLTNVGDGQWAMPYSDGTYETINEIKGY